MVFAMIGPEMTVVLMAGFSGCCLVFLGLMGLYVWSGVLNVTCFPVLIVSKVVDGASLGIWNLTMPNLSDAVYDRRIFDLVVSLKT